MPKEYVRRLRKEFSQLMKEPVPNITARPSEKNILVWYYVLEGHDDSPYRGGVYLGKLVFPPKYPHRPPAIYMVTPNGRFKTDTRICLSMSDYHPESWNPLWSVGSILTGLQSFMLENNPTAGSISTSVHKKRQLARASVDFNAKSPIFKKTFPELVEKYKDRPFPELDQGPIVSGGASKTADILTVLVALVALAVAFYLYQNSQS